MLLDCVVRMKGWLIFESSGQGGDLLVVEILY